MAKKIVFQLNPSGVGRLLRSAELQDDIMRRAGNIAAAAGDGHDVRNATTNRARAIVMTKTEAAARAEAENATLTAAIDAGRR